MPRPRKICVITGSRAEYGLLYWLLRGIDKHSNLQLQTVVTGMHLSPEFGLTYRQIEADGFTIDYKVEMLLSSDTPGSITRSTGLGMIGMAGAFEQLKPDLIVILGDRFEILAAASAATFARIPIAHIHGGETTEGAFDESIRHSVTKMSYLHFTSTKEYRNRVIQLGEDPVRVFNVGALGVENIKRIELLSRSELEEDLKFSFRDKNLMITFHPVTLETDTAKKQCLELLAALEEFEDVGLIFTLPNADAGGRVIAAMINEFVKKYFNRAVVFDSLGTLRYLSILDKIDGVVGNSSSGILEAPSFGIGTINIGDRQKGRVRAASVIDCDPDQTSISKSLQTLFSADFQSLLSKGIENPYDQGMTSESILGVFDDLPETIELKKSFYNLEQVNTK